ncbi:MAG: hypothetical protein IKG67_07855 [Parasporobacterium sp.]|nr:hypothetical protein [Parasporobacterium sp.]
MRTITVGDMMHVYGCFGAGVDYTVRLTACLTQTVDPQTLRKAIDQTARRYPYLCVRLCKGENTFYYEENPLPIALLLTDERISLNCDAVNYHVWAVCCAEDRIHLDFFHGITDGTGMYSVLATLLYYYGEVQYKITEPGNIQTADTSASEEELDDPQEHLSVAMRSDGMQQDPPVFEKAFHLKKDGKLTVGEPTLWDIKIPEKAFLRFTSAHDASPGTMISLFLARAIDSLYPVRDKKIISAYVINARPMLGAVKTFHNCLSMALLSYSDRVKTLPFSTQCTVYRGMTFLQSDADRIVPAIAENARIIKDAARKAKSIEEKKNLFGQMFNAGEDVITFLVSYVGKWSYPAVAETIREIWAHPSDTFGLMAEIGAVGGSICITLQQHFNEDTVREAFLHQLDENGIPYDVVRKSGIDNALFPEPEIS